jgi:hypothetical protein
MKAGVRISPRRIWIAPVRAASFEASIEKEKRVTPVPLAEAIAARKSRD